MPTVTSWSALPDPALLVALSYPAGRAAVIALSGALGGAARATLRKPVVEALDQGRDHVVLDLHEVRDADADGLFALSSVVRLTVQRGGTVSAVGLRPGLLSRVGSLTADGLRLRGTVRAALAAEIQSKGMR